MPTYEYACRSCGEHLEVVQSFKDEPLTECPSCHGSLRKVFGNIGIAFKGSGFYKTDSRSSTPATKSAGAAAAKTGTESGSGGSTGSSSGASSPPASEGSSSGSAGSGGSSGPAGSSATPAAKAS